MDGGEKEEQEEDEDRDAAEGYVEKDFGVVGCCD